MSNVTAAMVKALRQRTQAGMMDCKKALVEAEGDEEKAVEIIQKKGLAKVAKKSGAIAAEGVIHAYIHGGKIGVIVEINCQTDFVARNEDFKAFSDDMGMHIAASGPEFVRRDDIPADKLEAQRSLFRGMIEEEDKARGKSRAAEYVEKSVDGKLEKWVVERVLLEQESIVTEGKTIQQVQDELSAKIGEKISVRRFVRYELGEGIEKKKVDLAADVAATLAN